MARLGLALIGLLVLLATEAPASAKRRAHRYVEEPAPEDDVPVLTVTGEMASPPPTLVALDAGVRALHRTFTFNDPLANHVAGVSRPFSFDLPLGPAPFVDLAVYPFARLAAGPLRHLGIVGRYERLVATAANVDAGATTSTAQLFSQDYDVGLRARVPLNAHEVGLAATFGRQSFHVSDVTAGGQTGASVPDVDYTYVRLAGDAAVHVSSFTLGASLGTRLVTSTGSLQADWFPTTKTRSLEAGAFAATHVLPSTEIVVGLDYLRYAFDFNTVPPGSPVIAGGAVDQYVSGRVGLRVSE